MSVINPELNEIQEATADQSVESNGVESLALSGVSSQVVNTNSLAESDRNTSSMPDLQKEPRSNSNEATPSTRSDRPDESNVTANSSYWDAILKASTQA